MDAPSFVYGLIAGLGLATAIRLYFASRDFASPGDVFSDEAIARAEAQGREWNRLAVEGGYECGICTMPHGSHMLRCPNREKAK